MNESIRSGIKDGEDLKKHSFHKINSFNLVDLMHDQPFTVAIQHKTILTNRELNGEIDRALNQIELFSFKILKRGGEIGSGEMSRELNLIRKPFIDVVNLLALRLTYYTTRNQDMYPS
ncbi:MAG: hypothetical protein FGM17_08900, partial [Polynucleobacter sp.]|uniref:hypothetical protein n=1 Tax=Polynucleobacter sp. TaxID=2029855 RepID=UPI00216F7878